MTTRTSRLAEELGGLINGSLSHAQHSPATFPAGTGDGTLQRCSCGFLGETQFEMPLHRAIEFIKASAVSA